MARHYVSNRAPSTPRELADALSDAERMRDFLGPEVTPQAWHQFRDQFCENMLRDGMLDKQIAERAQVEAAGMLNAGRGLAGPVRIGTDDHRTRAKANRHLLYNRAAPGSAIDSLASDPDVLAKMFLAVANVHVRGTDPAESRRLLDSMQNAMSERVPSGGGFLVPEKLRSEVLMAALEQSIVRPRARIVPMDSLRVPYPTIDDTSHTSSVFGGVTAFWAEEAAALVQSQVGFGRVVLEAHKLAFFSLIPNELVADAPVLMQWLQDTLPRAVAFFEDEAFITGTGAGQPQGYINAPGAIQVTRKTASKVLFQDIANMFPRMLPVGMPNAIWICSPNVIGQLLQMVMPTADTTVTYVAPPLWLTNGSVAQGAEYSLLGHPLFITEKAPALGSTGDLAFVNLDYYLLGDRMTMSMETSEHYAFANDLLAMRLLERVDGRLWLQSPITPANGDSTLSPVVLLH